MEYKTMIDKLCENEDKLVDQPVQVRPRIKLGQMPEQLRYNKLKTESKLLMNVIKMICYGAESSVATWMAPFLAKAEDEKRMVVKQIIASNADLSPDYQNNTLTISLHSLSAQRINAAAFELTKILNETQTQFPDTNLKMIFQISAISDCAR
jgi:hypothetical protein